jgi:hypothetical protein
MKIYYWANLIINPIILFGVIILQAAQVEVPEEPFQIGMILVIGWIIASSLINPTLRRGVIKFFSSILGAGIGLGLIGGFAAIAMLIVVVLILAVAGVVGAVIALIYLWFTSLSSLKGLQTTNEKTMNY